MRDYKNQATVVTCQQTFALKLKTEKKQFYLCNYSPRTNFSLLRFDLTDLEPSSCLISSFLIIFTLFKSDLCRFLAISPIIDNRHFLCNFVFEICFFILKA